MNIKSIIEKDLPKFTGICVREGYIQLEEIKKNKVAMAYLFNKDRVKQYIGKEILLAASGKDRGKYFTAKIKNILSIKELKKQNKYESAINFHDKLFDNWINDRVEGKIQDDVLDKRMAIIFENPTEIKKFSADWVSFSRPSFYYIQSSMNKIDYENDLFRIKNLKIENFLNIIPINEDFASGINVIIGKNNTGKTGLIKFLYANLKAYEEYRNLKGKSGERNFKELLSHKIQKTFQSSERIGTIVNKASNKELKSNITFDYGEEKEEKNIEFSFKKTTKTEISKIDYFDEIKEHENLPQFNGIFIPTKEILSIINVVRVAMRIYEVGFDATYEDLLLAIEPPFKKEDDYHDNALKEIIKTIQEKILEGEIVYDKKNSNYYYKDNNDNRFDLTMTAEGIKQLGIIPILIKTGNLTQGSILFLDEPDNNLNPDAVWILVDILVDLANLGVQIFITTHNHLLSQLISLHSEYKGTLKKQIPEIKFFSLFKNENNKISIETGKELIDISNNEILNKYVELYDLEEAFYQSSQQAI